MLKRLVSLLAVISLLHPSASLAERQIRVNDTAIMDLIGMFEGPDGYDTITYRTRLRPPVPITGLTINQVIEFQDRVISSGASASAMGRFQFIRKTLVYLVDKHQVNGQRPFDRTTQDYLARMMLQSCDFYDLNKSEVVIANCLARVWAALPMASGPRAGKSYYAGNGNRSLTSVASVIDAIKARRGGGVLTGEPFVRTSPAPEDEGTYVISIGK